MAKTYELRPVGVGREDIVSTITVSKLLHGCLGHRLRNQLQHLQLAQALGSGRLSGDEFRSIIEQAPLCRNKETGVAVGQLKILQPMAIPQQTLSSKR